MGCIYGCIQYVVLNGCKLLLNIIYNPYITHINAPIKKYLHGLIRGL